MAYPPPIRLRYNPHRKRYFLTQGDVVGTKNGYDTYAKAEKARLRLTLAR